MDQEVFLHSNKHLYNLRFSEILMLRNYARSRNIQFSSMIGGPESIRDISEARNLQSESFEFLLIESLSALNKILSGIYNVFIDNLEALTKLKIFINLSTLDSLYMISKLNKLSIPFYLDKKNIIFNFDLESISNLYLQEIQNPDKSNIDKIITKQIKLVKSLNYSSSINSLTITRDYDTFNFSSTLPDYIKTSLFSFSFPTNTLNDKKHMLKLVEKYHLKEFHLLNLLKDSLSYRIESINL